MKATRLKFIFLAFVVFFFFSCNEAKYMQGKRTYDMVCADCHMEDGSGVKNLYPALKTINTSITTSELACIIRYGINKESSLIKMPPNPALKSVDITNIVNYILGDLNGSKEEYTLNEIEVMLEKCKEASKEQ